MRRILTITASLISLCAVSGVARSDVLGFSIGGYVWQQNYEGTILSSSSPLDQVDIQDDLGLDDSSGSAFYIVFEHPVPVLPNLRLQRTELDTEEAAQPSRSFDFDGISFVVTDTITTTSDLSHTDATLYYEVLDNWVSLDMGLTVRYFDEGVRLESATAGSGEVDLDVVIPMLYMSAKGELPLTGFYASVEANGVDYSDARLIDYKISLGYETGFGIGIELGLRNFDVDYEDDEDEANLTVDGGYAGVYYHF